MKRSVRNVEIVITAIISAMVGAVISTVVICILHIAQDDD